MHDSWHRSLHRFSNWIYFSRITVIHPERLPDRGPVLYLGLHRNGAVDGFVYNAVLRDTTFLISTQLRKSFFLRLFFKGIAVTRTKDDGDRDANALALQQCLNLLREDGRLFVFPEGTSSLGPRHLPFKSGAVQLLLEFLKTGKPIQVIPLGIHYECPWAFRGKVEVVVGQPIPTELSPALSNLGRLKELKRRLNAALETVGINVDSEGDQSRIQQLAYAATLAAPRSYFKTLKTLEPAIPGRILAVWQELEPEINRRTLLVHQGVPLFPLRSPFLYGLLLFVSGPLVVAAILLNLPAFAGARWAGKTFPDDRNVVSLWKILVGLPLLVLWAALVSLALVLWDKPLWLIAYFVVTVTGLKLYYRVKKLVVALHNNLRHPELRPALLNFRQILQQNLPAE